MISDHMQDYLKIAYKLSATGADVSTSAIAEGLGVSAASATNMIKKMAELKLVRHMPYHGVELTPAGRKVALEVIRHHRLLELYLSEALGYPWDQVHDEACRLEHALSERVLSALETFLENPEVCPHGHPIPSQALDVAPSEGLPLAAALGGLAVAMIVLAIVLVNRPAPQRRSSLWF